MFCCKLARAEINACTISGIAAAIPTIICGKAAISAMKISIPASLNKGRLSSSALIIPSIRTGSCSMISEIIVGKSSINATNRLIPACINCGNAVNSAVIILSIS